MNATLNSLDPQRLGKLIAYAAVTTGLAEASPIRDSFESWQRQGETDSFGNYLVANETVNHRSLSALLTIVEHSISRAPDTIHQAATAWLRGDIELKSLGSLSANDDASVETETIPISFPPSTGPVTPGKAVAGSEISNSIHSEKERFQIVSEHRQGGLGEVLVAHDTQLNRQVALKRIKEKFASKSQMCNRFIVEAELTGRLEHPGIVPVYGLGQSENGVPFYAMKFVQGQSLGDALKSFYGAPTQDLNSIEFRKLLRRFATVCYTIHFSHSRGILHRDIKPDNIMLGDFDETLVVDWGLAKVIGKKETGSKRKLSSSLYPASKNPNDNTQLGQVIGSPGYMSGEQALGWHDSLTPQSDVFSLGATLYAMLAGQPPFRGETLDDSLQNTIAGTLTPPRQLNAQVPKPLEAICLKAMKNTKSKRYPSALAMAEDIESYLADEPVSVWEEPISVRVRRWTRKHKTAVTTGLSAMVVLTVGALIASLLLFAANSREVAARKEATGNFVIAKSVIDDFLKQLADDPRLESASLEGLTSEMLTKAERLQLELEQQTQQDYSFDIDRADTGQRIAAVASKLGQNEKAIEHLQKARKLLTPHLNDKQDQTRVYDLMTQILLDYGTALSKVGKTKESIAVLQDGIKLSEKRMSAAKDPGKALAGKIQLVSNLDIAQQSIDDPGIDESRKTLWLSIDQFFKLPEQERAPHQVDISRVVLNKVALSEDEQAAHQDQRMDCMNLLEDSTAAAKGDSLAELRTKAVDSTALATAYATLDDKIKSYEVGMSAADQWYDLATKTPNVIAFKRDFIWSTYNAFLMWQEYEFASKNADNDAAVPLTADQIKKLYQRSAEMFRPIENEGVEDVEIKAVYAHLLGNLSTYLNARGLEPELSEQYLERALEVLEGLDTQSSANAMLVRNEVMRGAGIRYMMSGEKGRGRDVFTRQKAELRKDLQAKPGIFLPHRQLYDLHIVGMILENAMSEEATQETRQRAIKEGESAAAELQAIPDDVRKSHVQQITGMDCRLRAMLSDFYGVNGQVEKSKSTIAAGTAELVRANEAIRNSGPAVWVIEFATMSVKPALAAKDYQSPLPVLNYLLDKVTLPPNAKVMALSSRAKCHANLGNVKAAEADVRAAIAVADDALSENQLRLAVAAMMTADAIEDQAEGNQKDQAKKAAAVKFLDDHAKSVLRNKLDADLFFDEYFLNMILDLPDRMSEVEELKQLYTKLRAHQKSNN